MSNVSNGAEPPQNETLLQAVTLDSRAKLQRAVLGVELPSFCIRWPAQCVNDGINAESDGNLVNGYNENGACYFSDGHAVACFGAEECHEQPLAAHNSSASSQTIADSSAQPT